MRPDILHEISEKRAEISHYTDYENDFTDKKCIETHEDLSSLSLKSMQSREWKRLFGTLLKIP